MKLFKTTLFLVAVIFAIHSAGPIPVWAAAAPPRIDQLQRTADGYMMMGSGFGNDRARVQVFEGTTPVASDLVTAAGNVIEVRSQPSGTVQHKVVVAGRASNVVSFGHPAAAVAREPAPTPAAPPAKRPDLAQRGQALRGEQVPAQRAPIIRELFPNEVVAGARSTVTIRGINLDAGGPGYSAELGQVYVDDPDITVSYETRVPYQEIRVTLDLTSASPGPKNIRVQTSEGTSEPRQFTVLPSPPRATEQPEFVMDTDRARQGATVRVRMSGRYPPDQGVSVSPPGGITVRPTNVGVRPGSTQDPNVYRDFIFEIAKDAGVGERRVTVLGASNVQRFFVDPVATAANAPVITSLSPDRPFRRGEERTVLLRGRNLHEPRQPNQPGQIRIRAPGSPLITPLDAGAQPGCPRPDCMVLFFEIPINYPEGRWEVSVSTAAGGRTYPITVQGRVPPRLTGIAPESGTAGGPLVDALIAGSKLTGVTAATVSEANRGLTFRPHPQLQATDWAISVMIDVSRATPGTKRIRVTTPDGQQSNEVIFQVLAARTTGTHPFEALFRDVFRHQRCVNCHGGIDVAQGTGHGGGPQTNLANCTMCHSAANGYQVNRQGFAPDEWHQPDVTFKFAGTPGAICRKVLEHGTAQAALNHVRIDRRVMWSFSPGRLTAAPGGFNNFLSQMQAWAANGTCPSP